MARYDYDLFISHASEDKEGFVRELVVELRSRGLRVWFDEAELQVGDVLSRAVDDGLARCRFGVVVLSHAFFRKRWPRAELDALAHRELTGPDGVVVLPIWLGVDAQDVGRYSPLLASKLAIQSSEGVAAVADKLERRVRMPARTQRASRPTRHARHGPRLPWQLILPVLLVVATLAGAPWWWPVLFGEGHTGTPPPRRFRNPPSTTGRSPTTTDSGVIAFVGGCAPYRLFAQNRWAPYGAVARTGPDVTRKVVQRFAGNESVTVNGWVHATRAYPTNRPPWNSDIWFHLADGSGWVTFASVRAVPTVHDPTGFAADGGRPPAAPLRCEGSAE